MTTRDHAPIGAPCWADLWTSDVDGSRHFYHELFGWEAQAPDPNFGGYFMFTRNGVPIAGGMGDMGDMKANNTWKVYLASEDVAKTVELAQGKGAQVAAPAMEVGDAGAQAVIIDPTGATVGAWQAKQFPGITVLDEPGAPNWFELLTRDHAAAVDFYHSVFHCEPHSVGDSDEFRYTMLRSPDGDQDLAGVMDASAFLPEGTSSYWSVYWQVDDVDAAAGQGRPARWACGAWSRRHAVWAPGHGGRPFGRSVQAAGG